MLNERTPRAGWWVIGSLIGVICLLPARSIIIGGCSLEVVVGGVVFGLLTGPLLFWVVQERW